VIHWLGQERTPSPPDSPPAAGRETREQVTLQILRLRLKERGPRGERLAKLPDSILLAYSEGKLSEDDLTSLLILQDLKAKAAAKKQASQEDKKSAPPK
jgi:hypothetical protein